ncbi:DUF4238 domain-containing protein [Micromonospora aurantiaca]|uniref:DUF4238 domain-containing protein n=1 Tax=Micromonospora aurantiaca (nom. illeg.) TaxID=47850 RepID=UPI002E187CCA
MGQGQPRRHHQVPQFYLRGFADDSDRVKVVRFGEQPRTFVTSVKNVAVEANFYKVDWLDAVREDLAEKLIGKVEDAAVEPLRLLAQHGELTVQQRGDVATWVVLQYLRGRGKRVDSVGLQKLMLRADLALGGKQRLASRLGLDDSAEVDALWDSIVVRGELADPPTMRYSHLRTMFSSTISKVAAAYVQAHWQVVTFQRRRLFTSDQPVCLWRAPDDDPGVGLLTADAVSIPLNHTTGLVIFPQIPSGITGESAPTTQYHRWFLAHTWMSAEELLILHPDDELPDWLPAYREARLGTLGLPDIQQFIDIGEAWRTHQDRSQPAAEVSF